MRNDICIGIISYFPTDSKVRKERVRRCTLLLDQVDHVFPDIKTYIIAQNWQGCIEVGDNVELVESDKLGITNARKRLREIFLQSDYEWLITFDDDCTLEGKESDGDDFIKLLANNNGKCIINRNMFKLTAISRNVFEKFTIPELSVEEATGIEDIAFFKILSYLSPESCVRYDNGGTLKEVSRWVRDDYSTWNHKNIINLLKLTNEYISEKCSKNSA